MPLNRALPLLAGALFFFAGSVHASTLVVSVSGQFSSPAGNSATTLWAPNANWAISFDVDNNPSVSGTTTLGFDAPFTQFSYTLNGTKVAATPSFIRFSTTGNLGLFTLFFGPESGFQNGTPIPEFSFEGPQAFAGPVTSPVFTVGSFPVSDWVYSDAVNYDEDMTPRSVVTFAPTPEPATAFLLGLPLLALAFAPVRRLIRQN